MKRTQKLKLDEASLRAQNAANPPDVMDRTLFYVADQQERTPNQTYVDLLQGEKDRLFFSMPGRRPSPAGRCKPTGIHSSDEWLLEEAQSPAEIPEYALRQSEPQANKGNVFYTIPSSPPGSPATKRRAPRPISDEEQDDRSKDAYSRRQRRKMTKESTEHELRQQRGAASRREEDKAAPKEKGKEKVKPPKKKSASTRVAEKFQPKNITKSRRLTVCSCPDPCCDRA